MNQVVRAGINLIYIAFKFCEFYYYCVTIKSKFQRHTYTYIGREGEEGRDSGKWREGEREP